MLLTKENLNIVDAVVAGEIPQQNYSFSIDSRTIKPGEIFVAIRGSKVDGHNFIDEAIKMGAAGLIVEKDVNISNVFVIKVKDSLSALKQLAKSWREKFNYPIIGVTGSLGKTSTKEILREILKQANLPAYVTHENQNSAIGVSLNLLNLSSEYKVGVFEVGINDVGEMKEIAEILRPTCGIITTISYSHTKYLGTLQNVAREKCALFSYFSSSDIGIISGDSKILSSRSFHHPVVKFGTKNINQIQARNIKILCNDYNCVTNFVLKIYNESASVSLKSSNSALINNALGAAAVAHQLGIETKNIVAGIENYTGYKGRFEQKKLPSGMGVLINDSYNANPQSMKAALVAFNFIPSLIPKVAVLGDMLELGEKEIYWHRQIGRLLHKIDSIEYLILVGERSKEIAKVAPLRFKTIYVLNWQEAQVKLNELLASPKMILLKASNGVGLSNIKILLP